MKDDIFSQWCRQATGQIRYKPDRQAVYDELMAHLQDHRDSLTGQGMCEDAAARQALAAMGSSEEVAPQLGRIHRPFWGYVYRAVKIAAIVLCLQAAFWGIVSGTQLVQKLFFTEFQPGYQRPNGNECWEMAAHIQPEQSVWCDGYWIRISHAALWEQTDAALTVIDGYGRILTFDMEIVDTQFFRTGSNPSRYFWAVDSQGNRYASIDEAFYTDQARIRSGGYSSQGRYISVGMKIPLPLIQDIRWMELHYDRDGRDIVLRIDLPGGETT